VAAIGSDAREKPSGDLRSLLSGVTQNVVGMVVAGVALFAVQILMTRTLGARGFGVVTVLTQAAFVVSFATRSGMDMAVLREVAVRLGEGRRDAVRALVTRSSWIAGAVSVAVAVLVTVFSGTVVRVFSLDAGPWAVPAAALSLPFLALTNVWLAATRGLKIMRYTLYVFWVGQNVGWVVLTLILWRFSTTATASILAYSLSWVGAAVVAAYFWHKECRSWRAGPLEQGWLDRLLRYAGPRAPAALFAQLLFWTDLFVVTRYVSDAQVGVYSASLRAGQMVVLFLASVNLMFAPYVADLFNRGRRAELDRLYKSLTRWVVAGTLPVCLVILIAPGAVLRLFGSSFPGGDVALLILVGGQLVNVATGSAGLVLIMVGRTGYDLAIYAGSIALDVALTLWLGPRLGIEGAAIANAVTFTASNAARLAFVRHFVRIQPYDRDYLRVLPPAAAGAAVMVVAHLLVAGNFLIDLVVMGAAGGAVYVALYALVGLSPSERAAARRFLRRLRVA
jgi:O-antigen/teichoic acid export membrane protein